LRKHLPRQTGRADFPHPAFHGKLGFTRGVHSVLFPFCLLDLASVSTQRVLPVVDVAINQHFAFLTPHFLCRGPLLHGRYPLHHYYGLVRLPPVLLSGSPKFLAELSGRAILLYPVVCRPAHSRSLLDSFWFQTLRHPDHTNSRHEA
jgi:hypothetical protein